MHIANVLMFLKFFVK